MDRQTLLGEIRQRLLEAHGRRLHGVVLYGCEARGESRPDSDIDVLVLLEARSTMPATCERTSTPSTSSSWVWNDRSVPNR
jgi:uncharacterized protein